MKRMKMRRIALTLEIETTFTVADVLRLCRSGRRVIKIGEAYGLTIVQAQGNAIRPRRPDPVPAKAKRARK